MSAYACEPGRGSEPGAGWAWACAAAQNHDVWVLTHETNRATVTAALAADPDLAARLHPVFLRAPRWARPLRRRGVTRFLYYWVWQLGPCPKVARSLHAYLGFDVTHHLTYAADWMPAGVSTLRDVPFVWGPVGGSSTTGGPRLWWLLGARAFVAEAARAALLTVARVLVGRPTARRAALVLGQNHDVAAAFAPVPVTVEPNVAVEAVPAGGRRSPDGPPAAVHIGRLLDWKGLRLAIAALHRPEAAEWRLDVYGDGPARERLERLAADPRLTGRVRLHGHQPRDDVIRALGRADVLLFPSIRDAAGWSVAEAMAAGCPVLGLDVGGPATLVGAEDGLLADPHGDVVAALAAGLDRARRRRPRRNRWTAHRLPDLLDRLYAGVVRRPRREEAAR